MKDVELYGRVRYAVRIEGPERVSSDAARPGQKNRAGLRCQQTDPETE